ncbi:MAG: DUF3847 domain-containing protein [Eubacteriales bacterium]|nr:DUF3847 domain-containing protein [Eubacteriales bacterium]
MALIDELPPLDELEKIQAKNRAQMAENRQRVLDRKARSRRLYRRGAIIEKILPKSAALSDEEFQRFLLQLIQRRNP